MSDKPGFVLIECTKTFRNNELSIKEFDKIVDKSDGRSHEILSAIKPILPILHSEIVIVEYVVEMNKENKERICLISTKIGFE